MIPHLNHVLVAGSPGALVNLMNKYMASKGWAINWPGQDMDITHSRGYFDHNGQNFQVESIHQMICDSVNVNLLSDELPVYYDMPYPGPVEFISKFTTAAVISAASLPPFLDIWRSVADIVIDVQCDEAADLSILKLWTNDKFPAEYLKSVRDVYVMRYQQHLKLFPKLFVITNAEVANKRFEGLDLFLKNIR